MKSVQSFVNITNSSLIISFNELNLCDYIYYFNVIGIGNVNTEIVSQEILGFMKVYNLFFEYYSLLLTYRFCLKKYIILIQ